MERYSIKIGHDMWGDACWYVYDHKLRLTVARFDTESAAREFVRDTKP